MILDHEIRSKTNGKQSLEDLMTWMYKNYPRHEKLYELKDIVLSLKERTGVDFSEFMSEYVAGVKAIPIANYLHLSNALWSYKFNKNDMAKYKYLYQTLGIKSIEQ